MLYKTTKVKSGEDQEEEKHLTGFKAMPVFRAEDTEGAQLDYEIRLRDFDPAALPLIDVAQALGVSVSAGLTGDAAAWFRPSDNAILPVVYILGKRKTGKFDLLMVNFNMKKSLPSLLNDIKKNGVLDISLIVSGQEPGTIQEEREEINKIFPNAKVELCLTKLYQKLATAPFSTEETRYIDNILRQKSKSKALELCQNLSRPEIGNRYIFNRLFQYLSNSTVLYEYDTDKRSLIGTTNIIQYLGFDTQILLNTVNFANKMNAKDSIVIVTQNLLNEGKAFIPIWEKLIQPVNVKL
jgi:hypothetical protein